MTQEVLSRFSSGVAAAAQLKLDFPDRLISP